MTKQLLLARHAETGHVNTGRFIGVTDVELSERGIVQCRTLASTIKRFNPDRCFCSPMKRTRQTAEKVIKGTELKIEFDENFREINFGRWESKTFSEISAMDPELARRWAEWQPDFTFPEGESIAAFLERIQHLVDLLTETRDQKVLVVSHGGVIRALLCNLLGLSPKDYLLFAVQPATLAVVDLFDKKGVLAGLNLRDRE